MFILYSAIKFKKHYCLEISIPHTLSNPKLGKPDVTYSLNVLINKAVADNSRRRLKILGRGDTNLCVGKKSSYMVRENRTMATYQGCNGILYLSLRTLKLPVSK